MDTLNLILDIGRMVALKGELHDSALDLHFKPGTVGMIVDSNVFPKTIEGNVIVDYKVTFSNGYTTWLMAGDFIPVEFDNHVQSDQRMVGGACRECGANHIHNTWCKWWNSKPIEKT